MTRGEAAQLLFQILTTQFQIDAPPIAHELELVNRDGVHLNDYLKEIQKFPSIRQRFQKQGWKYVIDGEYISNFSKKIGMSCIGACSYGEKENLRCFIWRLPSTSLAIICMAHCAFPASFDALYEKEAEQGRPVLRDYAMTNVHEYFAEYFEFWVLNRGNEDKMLELKDLTPETYAYFSSLATNNWGLPAAVK